MILERIDRMEREVHRLEEQLVDLRAELASGEAPFLAVGAALLLAGFFYQRLSPPPAKT
ncbi:MAG TPA: hypothetical protein VFV63_17095 [Ilumatobacteraceae bacterium]|nr:hypothetical protein [Ilumatobacteraceae bacterium]